MDINRIYRWLLPLKIWTFGEVAGCALAGKVKKGSHRFSFVVLSLNVQRRVDIKVTMIRTMYDDPRIEYAATVSSGLSFDSP